MIGMQHRDLVHRLLDNRIENVFFRRDSKQHLQEITGIGEIVARIRGGLFNGVLVAHGGDSGHFDSSRVAASARCCGFSTSSTS